MAMAAVETEPFSTHDDRGSPSTYNIKKEDQRQFISVSSPLQVYVGYCSGASYGASGAYRQSHEDLEEVPEADVEAMLTLCRVQGQELEQLAVQLAVHELKCRHIGVCLGQDLTE